MERSELVHRVALAIQEVQPPGYVNGTPSVMVDQQAQYIVAIVEKVTLDNRRAKVIAFLEEGQVQAANLYTATSHPMWLGKVLAYADIIEAVRYGVLGEDYDTR